MTFLLLTLDKDVWLSLTSLTCLSELYQNLLKKWTLVYMNRN